MKFRNPLQNHQQVPSKFGTKHPWVKRIQFCLKEGPVFFQGRILTNVAKIHFQNLKVIPRTTGSISIKLCSKDSRERTFTFVQIEGPSHFQVNITTKQRKYLDEIKSDLQSHQINFNQTFYKTDFIEGDLSLFKRSTCHCPKGNSNENRIVSKIHGRHFLHNVVHTCHPASLSECD